MLSLKIKLNLDSSQKLVLETLSNEHRILYNFLLSSIKDKTLTFKELNQLYKEFRKQNELTINSKSAQNTCISLINSIKSFYALRKKDITAKFPHKFKSYKYFKTFMLDYNNGNGGFKLKDNILTLNLINRKHKLSINLPDYVSNKVNEHNISTITFKRDQDHNYFLIFVYKHEPKYQTLNLSNFLSIDLGYSNLVTCFSNKIDNFSINNLKLKKLEEKIEKIQSKRDKKTKYSIKYKKLNKTYKRKKTKRVNKTKDFQHKVSKNIIQLCKDNNIGSLIVGDIKVKKIQSKDNKKLSGISKSTLTIGRFKTFLEYKTKNEGIDFYKINEAYTSQKNCLTGEIMFSSDLNNRTYELKKGLFIDRDLNSAINIAKKVRAVWSSSCLDLNDLKLNRMFVDCNNNLQMSKIL